MGLWVWISITPELFISMTGRHDILFRTLADPTRRAIFEAIASDGAASVTRLAVEANISQPAASQHLRTLKAAGLVEEQRYGREARYRARAEGLAPLAGWMEHYAEFWRSRIGNLTLLLEEIDRDH